MEMYQELYKMQNCSQHSLWERLELYGFPLLDDLTYYSGEVEEVELISIDNPPKAQD